MKFDKHDLQRISPNGGCLGRIAGGKKEREIAIKKRNNARRKTRKRIGRMLDEHVREELGE